MDFVRSVDRVEREERKAARVLAGAGTNLHYTRTERAHVQEQDRAQQLELPTTGWETDAGEGRHASLYREHSLLEVVPLRFDAERFCLLLLLMAVKLLSTVRISMLSVLPLWVQW